MKVKRPTTAPASWLARAMKVEANVAHTLPKNIAVQYVWLVVDSQDLKTRQRLVEGINCAALDTSLWSFSDHRLTVKGPKNKTRRIAVAYVRIETANHPSLPTAEFDPNESVASAWPLLPQ